METIVVGIDGSPNSLAALRWAIKEAQLRKAAVDAVAVWSAPMLMFPLPDAGAPLYVDDDVVAATEQMLAEAVSTARADAEAAGVEVHSAVVRGAPGSVLVERSKTADLLVVGARGHGGFTELLLGSVSSQAVHHAACPVVVVRA